MRIAARHVHVLKPLRVRRIIDELTQYSRARFHSHHIGETTMKARLYVGTALTAVAVTAASYVSTGAALAADGPSLLTGKVVSAAGAPLAGIPIKAHRDNSAVTVAVYTDAKGEYSFPSWSDLTPGSYSVGVELPDFERTAKPVAVSEGKTANIDFTLKSKPLTYEDATASEI